MTDAVAADTASPARVKRIRRALAVAGLAVVIADWLFYDRPVGISAAIFIVVVAAGVMIATPSRVSRKARLVSIAILIASILPIVDNAGLLSLLSGVIGLGVYTLMVRGALPSGVLARFRALIRLMVCGPCNFFADVSKVGKSGTANPIVWTVPIGLGLIFLLLFRSANPLIEGWLDGLSPSAAVESINVTRVLFWFLTLWLTWSFLRARPSTRRPGKTTPSPAEERAQPGALFGPGAVLRSLIVFNVLFAFQTVLDAAYLWGGVALPEGMSYAAYAHRGAYPLISAALLAGAFVLVALKPGSDTERSMLTRRLVYVWVGQTVLLVVSSILRLNLYVEAYSLTYVRIAAFIWMFLVALGLALIVARIVLRRSNAWLVSANALALTATLYVCAFVNFPYVIAAYNVAHSKEVSGTGAALDIRYLCRLGPQVIPAIAPFVDLKNDGRLHRRKWDIYYQGCRGLVWRSSRRLKDWRAWTYRDWRLSQYLAKHGGIWTQ